MPLRQVECIRICSERERDCVARAGMAKARAEGEGGAASERHAYGTSVSYGEWIDWKLS